MRILVVSNTPWNTDNSFGNSFSNIFDGIEGVEFANIYCRYGFVNEPKVTKSFRITEKSLIKNLLDKSYPSGQEVPVNVQSDSDASEKRVYDTARKHRLRIFYWLRDFVWMAGRWKTDELKKFIDDFDPDIIFQPVYYSSYLTDIAQFCKKYTGKNMLGYISDDNYTLRQFNFSPFYWLERFYKRRKVRKTVEMCNVLYVISDIQKSEYEKCFTPPCKVLTKCADFEKTPPLHTLSDTVSLIYAGNISKGRGRSLSLISDAVCTLKSEGCDISFDIYTPSVLSEKMKTVLSKTGCTLHGAVSYNEILKLQKNADILVHAEGLSLKDRCEVHQSFSTKLVDFFEMGKCIFAVGTYDEAFAKHLVDNDAAAVATNAAEVYRKLKSLTDDKTLIVNYGKKAYECGKKHHDKKTLQTMVMQDLQKYSKDL